MCREDEVGPACRDAVLEEAPDPVQTRVVNERFTLNLHQSDERGDPEEKMLVRVSDADHAEFKALISTAYSLPNTSLTASRSSGVKSPGSTPSTSARDLTATTAAAHPDHSTPSQDVRVAGRPLAPSVRRRTASTWATPMRPASKDSADPVM